MKTSKFKAEPAQKILVSKPEKRIVVQTREPPIWLQIVIEDIRELFLLTKDKIPVVPKPKTETWDDWKDNL